MESIFSVNDKVVLVTGGSRGIGEMIATGFVAHGAKVYITSRKADVCEKVATALNARGPGQCIALPADLQSLDEIKRLVAELSKREDHLDVLINNAGATWNESFETYPDEAFEKIINLDLRRVFSLIQACFPLLTAKSSNSNPSRVINIGSVNGEGIVSNEVYAYTAAKSGLHHLTRHMAGKLGHKGVTFNNVAPGAFQSKMMAETLKKHGDHIRSTNPMGRIGSAEDIAGTCIYLASRAGEHTNGATIAVDGGSSWYGNRL
ncbi:hypothetical protein BDB00DRAFT_801593 [Zychaea mexicana]|uniref:uncharacterized protein n=1 Tax=Zychaea mexicana TaxID=64656 RepID=UPI0022FE9748|nr:uncharacterized protein BDB00DRAFT_801593 [Zychaea mexicana]KAI9498206.1 hypothetical protein BDB00DRAFT_801593 [Zychaea mexicana]